MQRCRCRSAWSTPPASATTRSIIAQAIATLAEMYPDRLWVALGSGEASNEHVTGEPWPPKPERNARLAECVEVIRRCCTATR